MTGVDAPFSGAATDVVISEEATAWRLLYRGAAGAFIVQAGGAALGLVVHAVLARLMGKAEYGVYALALTWVNVLSLIALLGQGSSVVRFVARYVHHGQWSELRGLRWGANAIVFAASAVIALGGTLIVWLMRVRLGVNLEWTLYGAFLLLPVLTQLQLSGALHQGLKRATSSGLFNLLLRPLVILVIAGSTVALGLPLSAPMVMVASCVGAAIALFLSEQLLMVAWPSDATRVPAQFQPRSWAALGGQLFVLDVIGIVINRVDVLLLGAFIGAAEIGPYYAATQLAALAGFGLNAVNTILAPLIAERYAARDQAGLADVAHKAAWLMLVVTGIVALGAVIAGHPILALFGRGFDSAYLPLVIIVFGQFIRALSGSAGFLMTMTRLENRATAVFGAGAVLNVALSLLLIPSLGITGAAVASASSAAAWSIASVVLVRAELHINPTAIRLRGR